MILSNYGYLHMQLGEADKALEYFKKSIRLYKSIDQPKRIEITKLYMADNYIRSGKIKKDQEFLYE